MITKPKKLTPASIYAQRAWGKIPLGVKKELRKTLPDKDKDGVPNGFDCRPKNKRKQESFLPVDSEYLSSNPSIMLGDKIASGTKGDIYQVKGNRNLVVKVQQNGFRGELALEKESSAYMNNSLNDEPLFIPTKVVKVQSKYGITGLVRPRVKVVTDYDVDGNPRGLRNVTDVQLEQLRRKLITLSHKGYALTDGLQIGIDASGRLLLFDADSFTKYSPGSIKPFDENGSQWIAFLRRVGRVRSSSRVNNGQPTGNDYYEAQLKYGSVDPAEHY